MKQNIKVGLALSAGAMWGLAHIGVLEVLEENSIPIDMVAGTSMGSVVGGLYCSGMKTSMMRKIAENVSLLEERKYLDFTIPNMGLLKGNKIKMLINTLTGGRRIEDLNIPFVAVSCCVEDAQARYFREGSLADAVRASIAIPGIFEPVTIDGKTYVDGGVVERLPVNILRKMGADFIIAVDVGYRGGKNKTPESIFEVLFSVYDLLEWEAMKHKVSDADATIHPAVKHINPATFSQAKECIDLGRKAALLQINELKLNMSMMGYSFKY